MPYRVVDLGHSPTPYQTRCRWPECSWKSRWHPRQQAADLEYTQHVAATHARGGSAE
ncbi:MAG TPA: hypothetical protein VIV12_04655 [Streptosporangiaceae bacterium]